MKTTLLIAVLASALAVHAMDAAPSDIDGHYDFFNKHFDDARTPVRNTMQDILDKDDAYNGMKSHKLAVEVSREMEQEKQQQEKETFKGLGVELKPQATSRTNPEFWGEVDTERYHDDYGLTPDDHKDTAMISSTLLKIQKDIREDLENLEDAAATEQDPTTKQTMLSLIETMRHSLDKDREALRTEAYGEKQKSSSFLVGAQNAMRDRMKENIEREAKRTGDFAKEAAPGLFPERYGEHGDDLTLKERRAALGIGSG